MKVYTKRREPEEYATILEVFKRGYPDPLCEVELSFSNGEPSAVYLSCLRLGELASECAGGGGCALSWEEMERALELAGWAANVLAGLAGIPAKAEKVGLVEARFTWDGELYVLPCLQVSIDSESYLMCRWAYLRRDPGGGWEVTGGFRLVPIGEAHIKIAEALAELKEMVEEYVENREREGAERARDSKYRGKLLELEEVVLRLPDGTEEVLLEPVLSELYYIGEDFNAVDCFKGCPEGGDSELADAVKKDLEEAWGVVVRAVRRYMETGDPRYAAFAYITVEALERAGLAPA